MILGFIALNRVILLPAREGTKMQLSGMICVSLSSGSTAKTALVSVEVLAKGLLILTR